MEIRLSKKTLAMGVVAAALVCLPLSASAADKLIVKDSTGTSNVFSVDDAGTVTAGPYGFFYSPDDYTAVGQYSHNNTGWAGSYFIGARSRGTQAAKLNPQVGDTIFVFDARIYDESTPTAWGRGGQIVGKVDGVISPGITPMRWSFSTKNTSGTIADRLTVKADGQVIISDLAGTGNAYACVDATGQLYRSAAACN